MLSFLGLRKESKKSPSEKEADGGFTIVGETLEEQRGKTRTQSVAQPSSGYVIVQPPKSSCPYPSLPSEVKRPAPPLPLPPLPPQSSCPYPSLPSEASCPYPALASDIKRPAPLPPPSSSSSVGESSSVLPDLLEDVPFSLSPHVLTVMSSLQLIPDLLLDPELSYNLSSFQYDFSLENSVLRNA
ncbi:UBAP1-MVB12-associated (UMA)-domain containing protein 1 isoform X2 [Pseudochaenichthys georgianus]|uniref:UBAP1-MVB12-associated (UMA)-domain containing protein 1 isoform X2 n=1 Tax=Pseudochaenichthys georgianus TaxID=52239 RepID=UPI00146C729E|nr:UBAP1-MVB12-associated (UMA)-domain containing protein 1 isoform X1 [Pseudochaenichthys georgianus]